MHIATSDYTQELFYLGLFQKQPNKRIWKSRKEEGEEEAKLRKKKSTPFFSMAKNGDTTFVFWSLSMRVQWQMGQSGPFMSDYEETWTEFIKQSLSASCT